MEGEGQKWSLSSKNPPGEGGLGVSAERLEYHPLNGGSQAKILPVKED
jgi:hypothetical protein